MKVKLLIAAILFTLFVTGCNSGDGTDYVPPAPKKVLPK